MNRTVAIGPAWPAALLDRLAAALPQWKIVPGAQSDPELARGATVVIPFSMKIGAELLEGSSIRLIHQFGVGVDGIDLEAARQRGVAVANAPSEVSRMATSVAEGAVLLVLCCARLPSLRAERLAAAVWNWSAPLNIGLVGKRAGLVGLGSIGKAIARRLRAFDMKLVGVRRHGRNQDGAEIGFEWIGGMDRLDELLATSDFVVISTPLTPETKALFDGKRIAQAKIGASFINVGRGGVIDETALLQALDDGHLHAAGLDTLQVEPPPKDSLLLSHPRVVLTPHDAGVSEIAFDGVARILASNLARLEAGHPLEFRLV